MDNKITAAIYYTMTTLLSLALCGGVIVILNWPILAEIPLAGAIFIHILALSKSLFNFWSAYEEHFAERMTSRIKATLFSLDTQEEEVNV